MENNTAHFLIKLQSLDSKEKVIKLVTITHQTLKNKLMSLGIEFYEDETLLSQSIVSQQNISNSISESDIRFYNEIDFIRCGINGRWIDNIFEKERFESIRKMFEPLIQR